MTTNYPGSIDSFTRPGAADALDSPSHSSLHDDALDAIEAIETELGTDPAGSLSDVVTFLQTEHSAEGIHSTKSVKDGATTVGYAEHLAANDVDGAATTIIADGSEDVTERLQCQYLVVCSDGQIDSGVVFVDNNSSWDIFDDGTNVLKLDVSSGAVTLQRTSGTETFDVVLDAIWI